MIDIAKYKIILDEGLLLDHYLLLCNLRDGKEMVRSKRVQGFINLMHKKGYIEDGILTSKAFNLIEGEGNPTPIKPVIAIEAEIRAKTSVKLDYATWVIALHKKVKDKLITGTGKPQVKAMVEGKGYPFLPNSTDLGKVILRAVKAYKLDDFDKIEKTLLRYVDTCVKLNKWTPLLNYYVMKHEASTMVTDMENLGDEESNDNNASIHIV